MKTGILIALSADKREGAPLSGVLPFSEALERFKALNVGDTGPAPYVELWASSGGCVRSKKFAKFGGELPIAPGVSVDLKDFVERADEEAAEGEAADVIKPEGGQAGVPASLPGAPQMTSQAAGQAQKPKGGKAPPNQV